MSNEIKKPSDEASEVSVARYLMRQFPEWKEQLSKLVCAYEMPFQHFCEKEAAYRLDELGIPDTIHDYLLMVTSIASKLFDSETFTDGDVADQITTSVLDRDFCIDLKDEKQVLFLKENYFKSEMLLTISELKSNIPFLASFVCKTNIKKSNRNMEHLSRKFWKILRQIITILPQKSCRGYSLNSKRITGTIRRELKSLAASYLQKKIQTQSIQGFVFTGNWTQNHSIDMLEVKKVFEDNEDLQDNETALDEEYRMEWSTGIASEKDYTYYRIGWQRNYELVRYQKRYLPKAVGDEYDVLSSIEIIQSEKIDIKN